MDKLLFTQRLCNGNEQKKRITVEEEYDDGRKRYRLRQNFGQTGIRFASTEVTFQITAVLIHWMIRMNFFSFLFLSIVLYVGFSIIFAFIIMAVSVLEPKCVTSEIFEGDSTFISRFNDACNLSWTTFSTVGYGVVSPSSVGLFVNDGNIKRYDKSLSCAVMNFTLSFESLVGILFVSFAATIIYVKLIQFQSNAQIKFSSIMVVKYGSGVEEDDIDDDSILDSDDEVDGDPTKKEKQEKIPCPVLVFRMANLLNTAKNGEIVNASVHTMATIDIKNAIMTYLTRGNTVFKNALNTGKSVKVFKGNHVYLHNLDSKEGHRSTRHWVSSIRTASFHGDEKSQRQKSDKFGIAWSNHKSDVTERGLTKLEKQAQQLRSSMVHFGISPSQLELSDDDLLEELTVADTEGDDDYLGQSLRPAVPIAGLGESNFIHKEMPNLVFAKVEMQPEKHPYFKTAWRLQHTLNDKSPLLTKEARKKVTQNGGYWPAEMNNLHAVEQSIDFDQILVTFQGLSKSSGNNVYDHVVYKKEDIKIGYQFKSILVHNDKSSIPMTEPGFIDDIKDQNGGRY